MVVELSKSNGMLAKRFLRCALKLRYLMLGGAIYTYNRLNSRYKEWREGLPNFKWLYDVSSKLHKISNNLKPVKESAQISIEIGSEWGRWLCTLLSNKYEDARQHPNTEYSINNTLKSYLVLTKYPKKILRNFAKS